MTTPVRSAVDLPVRHGTSRSASALLTGVTLLTLEGTADWLYPPQNTDQLTPAKPFKLYPTSPTTFAFRATNGTAVFQTGGDGEVLGVSVTTWGEPFQGSKQ